VEDDDASEVKEDHGETIGRNFGNVSENDDVDGGGEDGLHDKPDRSQNGLFVNSNDIPPDEHAEQILGKCLADNPLNEVILQFKYVISSISNHIPQINNQSCMLLNHFCIEYQMVG
jgi:hypothetical protein